MKGRSTDADDALLIPPQQPIQQRSGIPFELPLDSIEPSLVLLPDGAGGINEHDGEADDQQHDADRDNQPQVHERFDNQPPERFREDRLPIGYRP